MRVCAHACRCADVRRHTVQNKNVRATGGCVSKLCAYFRVKIVVRRVGEKSGRVQFSCIENSNIVQSNLRRKRVVFFVVIIVQSFFSIITSGVNWVVVGLIGVCGFTHVVLKVIIVICNGSEVRVMGTRSRFSIPCVLTFAFSVEPTGVLIVETFESVFAFALGSSLALLEMNAWMLDDECVYTRRRTHCSYYYIMKVDTVQSITQWRWRTSTSSRSNEPLRPDLAEAEHVVVNYLPVNRGYQPRTINHEGRNAE